MVIWLGLHNMLATIQYQMKQIFCNLVNVLSHFLPNIETLCEGLIEQIY